MHIEAADLGGAIVGRPALLVDLGVLLVLGVLHVLSNLSPVQAAPDKAKLAESLRGGSTGGLTIVGILIPLSVIAIQLRSGTGVVAQSLPHSLLVDFFVGDVWLVISLTCGLYVLFVTALRGTFVDVGQSRTIRILFGFQLIFLFVGVYRLVWGLAGLVGSLLST
jgi:hypothetical protein